MLVRVGYLQCDVNGITDCLYLCQTSPLDWPEVILYIAKVLISYIWSQVAWL